MDVATALAQRHSVRAFLPTPVPADTVRALLEGAARAPSGGNLQPWRAVALAGEPLAALVSAAAALPGEESAERPSYPPHLWEPYRTRRFENGEDLYRTLDIGRDDKPRRLLQLARNAAFFGAPVGVVVCADRRMGHAQWVDLGAWLQSFLLLAASRGLATCAQGFWRRYEEAAARVLELAPEESVAFGIALGHEDLAAPINTLRTPRAPLAEWAELRGF